MATSTTLPWQNDAERLIVSAGLMMYVVSFGLPAVNQPLISGWSCAMAALTMPLRTPSLVLLPLFCAGIVNLIALAFVTLWFAGASEKARYRLALWGLGLLPMSAVFFAIIQLAPGVAYFAWIAGLLMMLGPEAVWYFRGGRR